jgi:hypothetical protein
MLLSSAPSLEGPFPELWLAKTLEEEPFFLALSPDLKTADSSIIYKKTTYPTKVFGQLLHRSRSRSYAKQALKVWRAPSRVVEKAELKPRKEPCKNRA